MNTIVVATDFSSSADNAALYAAHLASKLNASLLIVHIYQVPVTLTQEVPVLIIPIEELKQQADGSLERSRELISKQYDVQTKIESRMGDVNDELEAICSEHNPMFVVVGKHGTSGVEKALFGSTTQSVVKHSKVPVLAIHENNKPSDIQNAAFAVDLANYSNEALRKIQSIVSGIGCKLHVVHVDDGRDDISVADINQILKDENPVYKIIKSDDFVNALQQYISEKRIDLLITVPHKHNLMERLFFKTHTVELVDDIHIPILTVKE
jgi:nucleotide-binding universal stress UspA family protein